MNTPNTKTPNDMSLVEESSSGQSQISLDFICEDAPEDGSLTLIDEGIYWLRMPLPMQGLNHINLWVLRDGESWTIVDTGLGSRDSKKIWKQVFETTVKDEGIKKVIATHLHPDHTGLVGWICRKYDAPLLMTRGEYMLCRLMAADTGNPAPQFALDFYHRAGFTADQIELYKARFGGFGKAITPMPEGYVRMQDGDTILINDEEWIVLVGAGHSPEHACLYNPIRNIVISGDQLLPNISSNVSVWPTEYEGNPLEDWIDSCKMLIHELPEDVLVLPAHGIPFRGAHRRLNKLIVHHEKALTRLLKYCETPRMAVEVYSCLFRREINDSNRIAAVGESIAHLNCLVGRGLMTRRFNDAGQFTYKTKS